MMLNLKCKRNIYKEEKEMKSKQEGGSTEFLRGKKHSGLLYSNGIVYEK